MFTKSIDNGNNFSSPIRLHHSFQHPSNIELAQHEGNVYIAVQGLLPNSSNYLKNDEIFLITSIDNGDTFSKVINISNNSGVSECPSIAIYNNKIYLTWEDITQEIMKCYRQLLLKRKNRYIIYSFFNNKLEKQFLKSYI